MDVESFGSAESSPVRVYVRLRPREDGKDTSSMYQTRETPNGHVVSLSHPSDSDKPTREFILDKIMLEDTNQEIIFDSVAKPLCDHVLQGFNACCVAYGQTGAGKTYSVVGESPETRGIIPRSAEYIFKTIKKRSRQRECSVFVSFVEIYLDAAYDLLSDRCTEPLAVSSLSKAMIPKGTTKASDFGAKGRKSDLGRDLRRQPSKKSYDGLETEESDHAREERKTRESMGSLLTKMPGSERNPEAFGVESRLKLRETADGTVFVQDLNVSPVSSPQDVYALLDAGMAQRATFGTDMNARSSRSHTVFSITILQRDRRSGEVVRGTLYVLDLAGSERVKKSGSIGQRFKEATEINKSLSSLGHVIMAINRRDKHIPYRDSKLTRMLQDTFGGNSFTTVLCNVNPMPTHYEESLSTLQFANRCRNVTNQPRVNFVPVSAEVTEVQVQAMQEEIAELKSTLQKQKMTSDREIEELKTRLVTTEDQLKVVEEERRRYGSFTPTGRGKDDIVDSEKEQIAKRFNSRNQQLQEKLDQRQRDFRAVQSRVKAERERMRSESEVQRLKILELLNDVKVGRSEFAAALNEQMEAHEREVEELIAHNQCLLMQATSLLDPRVALALDILAKRKDTEDKRNEEKRMRGFLKTPRRPASASRPYSATKQLETSSVLSGTLSRPCSGSARQCLSLRDKMEKDRLREEEQRVEHFKKALQMLGALGDDGKITQVRTVRRGSDGDEEDLVVGGADLSSKDARHPHDSSARALHDKHQLPFSSLRGPVRPSSSLSSVSSSSAFSQQDFENAITAVEKAKDKAILDAQRRFATKLEERDSQLEKLIVSHNEFVAKRDAEIRSYKRALFWSMQESSRIGKVIDTACQGGYDCVVVRGRSVLRIPPTDLPKPHPRFVAKRSSEASSFVRQQLGTPDISSSFVLHDESACSTPSLSGGSISSAVPSAKKRVIPQLYDESTSLHSLRRGSDSGVHHVSRDVIESMRPNTTGVGIPTLPHPPSTPPHPRHLSSRAPVSTSHTIGPMSSQSRGVVPRAQTMAHAGFGSLSTKEIRAHRKGEAKIVTPRYSTKTLTDRRAYKLSWNARKKW
ncbi:Kinesin like protein [Aduncisulcus paluster]|uniref:Kinesin like protein n=1 Tax=Aduncisulcus paluster TaxID=2918883 RepID=A0ABQ5KK41_9EUKA|nr:Kinesin like protein [Aduncisulcus paluster]